MLTLEELKISYNRTPFIRTMFIRTANYPDRLGPSGKFVENCTKLGCLEITGYKIQYSRVLWLLELQIRRGRKIQTQAHTVNSNSRTSNCQCSLFSKKNPIIRNFCLSGRLAVQINPDKWSSSVHKIFNVFCGHPLLIAMFRRALKKNDNILFPFTVYKSQVRVIAQSETGLGD